MQASTVPGRRAERAVRECQTVCLHLATELLEVKRLLKSQPEIGDTAVLVSEHTVRQFGRLKRESSKMRYGCRGSDAKRLTGDTNKQNRYLFFKDQSSTHTHEVELLNSLDGGRKSLNFPKFEAH